MEENDMKQLSTFLKDAEVKSSGEKKKEQK